MNYKIVVTGACGRMGREVVKTVDNQSDMELVGAVDMTEVGKDIGDIVGIGKIGVNVTDDLSSCLKSSKPTHVVDFTSPSVVKGNVMTILDNNAHPIVGTTGLSKSDIDEIGRFASEKGIGALIAPNFAVGAVLMMRFAAAASRFFNDVEIIELHHDRKVDAPSGTAIKTAEMIAKERKAPIKDNVREVEILKGARGGALEGIKIHSVRLPGLIAHQEVLLGDEGQTLTIRHDSMDRTSFMPGIVLGIRKIGDIKGLVYGLDNLLDIF